MGQGYVRICSNAAKITEYNSTSADSLLGLCGRNWSAEHLGRLRLREVTKEDPVIEGTTRGHRPAEVDHPVAQTG